MCLLVTLLAYELAYLSVSQSEYESAYLLEYYSVLRSALLWVLTLESPSECRLE